ncbi:hypothetical protein MNBD_GAMMA10-1159, partial [hydrothermal vent metagenome]
MFYETPTIKNSLIDISDVLIFGIIKVGASVSRSVSRSVNHGYS